jgi:hypothetical protein
MIGIALCVLVYFFGFVLVSAFASSYERDPLLCGWGLIGLLLVLVLGMVLVPMTGGLMEGYSEGTREGYITKLSVRGVMFKTNEGQMQMGTGEMAALQQPWEFSCPDEERWKYLNSLLGKRVIVQYKEWLVQPWWRGDSGYEITHVRLADTSPEVANR